MYRFFDALAYLAASDAAEALTFIQEKAEELVLQLSVASCERCGRRLPPAGETWVGCLVDDEGRVLYMSQRMIKAVGLPWGEISGRSIFTFFPHRRARRGVVFQHVLEMGQEYVMPDQGIDDRQLEIRMIPLFDAIGPARVLVLIQEKAPAALLRWRAEPRELARVIE